MLMLKKPKRESLCSGSCWLFCWHKSCGYQGKTQTGFAPELLKYVLDIFRDIGANLNFIQVLFLIESVN